MDIFYVFLFPLFLELVVGSGFTKFAHRQPEVVAKDIGASNRASSRRALVSYQAQNDQGFYKFGYAVPDGQYRVEEGSPVDGVLGSYGYVDTRGREIKVYYKAGVEGFQIINAETYRHLRAIKHLAVTGAPQPSSFGSPNQNRFDNNRYRVQLADPAPQPRPTTKLITNPGNEYHGGDTDAFYDYSDLGDNQQSYIAEGVHQEFLPDKSLTQVAEMNTESQNANGGVTGWPLYRSIDTVEPFPVYYFPSIHQYSSLQRQYPVSYAYPFEAKKGYSTQLVIRA